MIGLSFLARIIMLVVFVAIGLLVLIGAYFLLTLLLAKAWEFLEWLLPQQTEWLGVRFKRLFPKRKRRGSAMKRPRAPPEKY